MGLRFFGFQNSGLFSGPANALPTAHTKPFLPLTAISKFFSPSTMTSASRDIDAGAAVRASAISASRSIRYCAIGAMLGYGDLASCAFVSCAWIGHAAPNTATNIRIPPPIALPVLRSIDRLLFDVNFAHGAPFAVPRAAWKWVFPHVERVGMALAYSRSGPPKSHSNLLPVERDSLEASTRSGVQCVHGSSRRSGSPPRSRPSRLHGQWLG